MSTFGEKEVILGIEFYANLIHGAYPKKQPNEDKPLKTIINELIPVPEHPNLWIADFTIKKEMSFSTSELLYLAIISEDKVKAPLGPRDLHNDIFVLASGYASETGSHYGIKQVESLRLPREQLILDPSKGYSYRPYHDSLRISTIKGANFIASSFGIDNEMFVSELKNHDNESLRLTVALATIYRTYYGTRYNELP